MLCKGVNGVNRLAGKGEKILLTTDKTRKKLPTSDKKLTEIHRQPTIYLHELIEVTRKIVSYSKSRSGSLVV